MERPERPASGSPAPAPTSAETGPPAMPPADAAERTAVRGDRRISFTRIGPPLADRPAVVAIPGGPGFGHRYLRPWLDPLGRDQPVVYFDLPGSGRSSRHPGSGYPLADYVADLETVRAAAGVDRWIPVAHAWGAILAVEYALAHPARVAGLALVNPLVMLRLESQDHEAQARAVSAVDPGAIDAYVTGVLPAIQRAVGGDAGAWAEADASPWWVRMWRTQFVSPPPVEWDRSVVESGFGLESYFDHKGAAMMVPDHPLAGYELAERARGLSGPILIVGSDADANYVAPARIHATPLHRALPGSELAMMSDAGHFPFVERSAEFLGRIGNFLDRIGR